MTPRRRRCAYAYRHWFTVYGYVGVRAPRCQHCGDPNPNWDEATMGEAFDGVVARKVELYGWPPDDIPLMLTRPTEGTDRDAARSVERLIARTFPET